MVALPALAADGCELAQGRLREPQGMLAELPRKLIGWIGNDGVPWLPFRQGCQQEIQSPRTANRFKYLPDYRSNYLGFRLARTLNLDLCRRGSRRSASSLYRFTNLLSSLDISLHDTALRFQKSPKTGRLVARFRRGLLGTAPCHGALVSAIPFEESYCLSYTATLSICCPLALTPFVVNVNVLPSLDTTRVPL